MSFFDRIADSIFRIAVSDGKRRWLLTPLVGLIFLSFITALIFIALLSDEWLHLPSISMLPWTLIAAIILLIPGIVLWAWTVFLFLRARGTPVPINPPQELIMTGIYAYSRNPMMLGLFLTLFGIGLIVGSFSLTFIVTPLFIIIMTVYARKIEEKELELKFGNAYLEYRKKVGMYFPKFK